MQSKNNSMEVKKNEKADLNKNITLFRQMGLILSLGILYVAFEYSYSDIKADKIEMVTELVVEEEMVPITRAEMPPPPPPQMNLEIITIVDDDIVLDDELDLEDLEMDEDSEVEILDYAEEEEVDDDLVFQHVERMPEFPGGYAALMKYLSKNLEYPNVASENGIQGRVYVNFIIFKDGQIGDVKILKGVDRFLDKEAVRVVQQMPEWSPGEQRGRKVNVSFNLPVNFTLN